MLFLKVTTTIKITIFVKIKTTKVTFVYFKDQTFGFGKRFLFVSRVIRSRDTAVLSAVWFGFEPYGLFFATRWLIRPGPTT